MKQQGKERFSKSRYVLDFLKARLARLASFEFAHGFKKSGYIITKNGGQANLALFNAMYSKHEAGQVSVSVAS